MKIFHHNDADGRCAAAIVLKAHMFEPAVNSADGYVGIELIEMDYAKPVPVELIKHGEHIVIVDFSFKEEDMARVRERTSNIVWIDHHKTAEAYNYQDLLGLRDFSDKGRCGCELAWMFYFPDRTMPWSVNMIGDYDSWRMQLKPSCLEFYEGLKLYEQDPFSNLWVELLADDERSVTERVHLVMAQGRSAITCRDNYCRELIYSFGYPCSLVGADQYKCYALNAYRFGSQAYESVKKGIYDIFIAYISDGLKTTVSLYSENPEIDVGEIAKLHNGGGHKGAAGFVVPFNQPLPFQRL